MFFSEFQICNEYKWYSVVHYFAIYVYEWIIFDTFIQIDCVHLSVQRELFIKVVSSHSIRMFLEWFTLTQMFDVFITDRLKDDFMPGQVDYFMSIPVMLAYLLTYIGNLCVNCALLDCYWNIMNFLCQPSWNTWLIELFVHIWLLQLFIHSYCSWSVAANQYNIIMSAFHMLKADR